MKLFAFFRVHSLEILSGINGKYSIQLVLHFICNLNNSKSNEIAKRGIAAIVFDQELNKDKLERNGDAR